MNELLQLIRFGVFYISLRDGKVYIFVCFCLFVVKVKPVNLSEMMGFLWERMFFFYCFRFLAPLT